MIVQNHANFNHETHTDPSAEAMALFQRLVHRLERKYAEDADADETQDPLMSATMSAHKNEKEEYYTVTWTKEDDV